MEWNGIYCAKKKIEKEQRTLTLLRAQKTNKHRKMFSKQTHSESILSLNYFRTSIKFYGSLNWVPFSIHFEFLCWFSFYFQEKNFIRFLYSFILFKNRPNSWFKSMKCLKFQTKLEMFLYVKAHTFFQKNSDILKHSNVWFQIHWNKQSIRLKW